MFIQVLYTTHVHAGILFTMATMDDFFDQYDYYNFGSEFDKMASGMKGGHAKNKEKKENLKYTPSGHVRKVVTKLQNAEKKEKVARQRLSSV